MNDSYIRTAAGSATTFAGPDAVHLFQATVVCNAIRLYLRTGMKANRMYTPANMLATASSITGHSYKRGRRGLDQAAFDLDRWCRNAAAKIPVVEG